MTMGMLNIAQYKNYRSYKVRRVPILFDVADMARHLFSKYNYY